MSHPAPVSFTANPDVLVVAEGGERMHLGRCIPSGGRWLDGVALTTCGRRFAYFRSWPVDLEGRLAWTLCRQCAGLRAKAAS